MTMHLVGPWLSTTGKKAGRKKFRNAAQAQRTRENQENWQQLLGRHGETKKSKGREFRPYKPSTINYRGRNDPQLPSLETQGDPCYRPAAKTYTGDKMIGVGTMHKSNMVPIFSDTEAKEISTMRRG